MEWIKNMYKRYGEIIKYLIFGVLTTIVNYVVYLVASLPFRTTTVPTLIAWFVSVIFAFVTNRRFVFHSEAKGREIVPEAGKFVAARVLSGIVDILFMWIFADLLHFNDKIMKLVSNVFVVIFNYIASKLVIFKKK